MSEATAMRVGAYEEFIQKNNKSLWGAFVEHDMRTSFEIKFF